MDHRNHLPENSLSPLGAQLLHLDRRRLFWLAILAVLTGALLVTLAGGQTTLATFAQANWRLAVLALVVHYSGFAVRGHRWQLLLGALGHRLSYFYTTGVLLSGWFASALLPARAGDALRMGLLRVPPPGRSAVPVPDSLGSIVMERALDIVAILVLSAGFGFVLLGARFPAWLLVTYGLAVLLLAVLGAVLVLMPAMLDRLYGWSRNQYWRVAVSFVAQAAQSLRRLPRRPVLALVVLGESFYIWLCDALLLWLVVWSLGGRLPFSNAAFVALTVDVFAAVPLTPGGMGQVESAYAALLALLPPVAVSIPVAVLAIRGVSYWSFLLVSGAVTFVSGFGRMLTAGGARPVTEVGSIAEVDSQ